MNLDLITHGGFYAFFYEHADWSYDPTRETSEQGRQRCAVESARAYAAFVADPDVWVEWEDDDIPWDGDMPYDGPIYQATLKFSDGEPLASLCGIAVESTHDSYCRVIEADLYAEFDARREANIVHGES